MIQFNRYIKKLICNFLSIYNGLSSIQPFVMSEFNLVNENQNTLMSTTLNLQPLIETESTTGFVENLGAQGAVGYTGHTGHIEHTGFQEITDSVESTTETESTPLSKASQMIAEGKTSKNKSYKKMMKKMQNDPKMQELVNFFQKNPNMKLETQSNLSTKDKLRQRLKDAKLDRAGPKVKDAIQKKKREDKKKTDESETSLEPTEEQKLSEIQEQLNTQVNASLDEVSKHKKQLKDKMKKLQQKYGQVSLERYGQALKLVSEADDKVNPTVLNQEKNVIALYLKQNPNAVEKQLNLTSDPTTTNHEDTEDELHDLEN